MGLYQRGQTGGKRVAAPATRIDSGTALL
jgi:hypothetical protein